MHRTICRLRLWGKYICYTVTNKSFILKSINILVSNIISAVKNKKLDFFFLLQTLQIQLYVLLFDCFVLILVAVVCVCVFGGIALCVCFIVIQFLSLKLNLLSGSLYYRQKLEEKARLYEQMTKGDFPGIGKLSFVYYYF